MGDITRLKQRFDNYQSMLNILEVGLTSKSLNEYSEIELIGYAKTFELSFELMWKLFKDYLEYMNVSIGLIAPKSILKIAASNGLLDEIGIEGETLIQAASSRNELVHIYDEEKFHTQMSQIQNLYLIELVKVKEFFLKVLRDE